MSNTMIKRIKYYFASDKKLKTKIENIDKIIQSKQSKDIKVERELYVDWLLIYNILRKRHSIK